MLIRGLIDVILLGAKKRLGIALKPGTHVIIDTTLRATCICICIALQSNTFELIQQYITCIQKSYIL